MAENRPKVPAKDKRILVEQARGKCANPGCPDRLIEIHHIHEWAVYQTHDANHMIAICPACHDQVTRGELRISDEELYRWKGINPVEAAFVGSIFVEPGPAPSLSFGGLIFQGTDGITLFEFGGQKVCFAVKDGELVVLNVKLLDSAGTLLVDVVDNYIRQRSSTVKIVQRTGRWIARGPLDATFLPQWVIEIIDREKLAFGGEDAVLLDIEVMAPGTVRIAGAWADDRRGVVTSEDGQAIYLFSRKKNQAIAFAGGGSMMFFDTLDEAVFDRLMTDNW